jgi:putative DNA primase/helicase
LNEKAAIGHFKDGGIKDYNDIRGAAGYGGVIARDAVLIDVDDYEMSEKLLDIIEAENIRCRVYETTRGKHFYFKNVSGRVEKCATGARLACGLTADIKCGRSNCYGVLKKDGKKREILYEILKDEEYQEIPAWLLPVQSTVDFDLEDGDGRNQTLYNYILTLQSNGFTKEEARETLGIINKYIFKEPLTEQELETLSRDEAFAKEQFYKGSTFLFAKFAQFLKSEYHIIRIDNQLHIYEDGIYKGGYANIETKMIKHLPTLNRAKRAETLAYLELLCSKEHDMSDAKYIAFRNGVYDLGTGQLIPFTPDLIILNKIDWNYNPDAVNADVDKMFDKLSCGDASVRALLCEAIGYCFYRRNELRKAFILTGEKQNGKSTYLKLINYLLGDSNVTNLDLSELGQRFKAAELFGKLANIGDDIGDEFIANPAIFKKVVSGDPVNVERKGENPFDLKNYSKFLFSANNIPRIKDKSGAVISRLVIIPFNARFTEADKDFDPYIIYKLTTENAMEYLINVGLEGLKRVLKNYKFTESEKVVSALAEYEENNNPILLFFKDISKEDILHKSSRDLYSRYRLFCAENNFNPMSNIEFTKAVKKHFDVDIKTKRLDGKKYRMFTEKGEADNDG